MSRSPEHELIERCRSGDESAFRELVDQYKGLVFALVSRERGRPGRAEDLAQDVFLRVHRGLPYFRGESKLSTWIYRIVANLLSQERPELATASLDAVVEGRATRRGVSRPRRIDRSGTWCCAIASTRRSGSCRCHTRCS